MEKDYSGFNDKVNNKSKASYNAISRVALNNARLASKPVYCLGIMRQWLAFFNDGHASISLNQAPAITDTAVLNKWIRETEVIDLTDNSDKLKKSNGVEGVYVNADSSYKIAIIKSKTNFRDYAGVIISSKSANWKPGQVKLELKNVGANKFITYVYYRDHSVQVEDYVFDGGSFNDGGWTKEDLKINKTTTFERVPVAARKISDQTFYVQIGNFEDWNAKGIDSVFKANENALKSVPYLILDLRGNGGGADFAYGPVSPYLYTDPIRTIGEDVLASQDNINGWLPLLTNKDLPPDTKEYVKKTIANMQADLDQFVSTGADDTTTMAKIEPYPKKVVILMDGHCASTAEQFLLESKFSKKVTRMGQRSAGILDYANVREIVFPCLPYTLNYPTTRSRRVDVQQGIDNVGIKPDIELKNDVDWIAAAMKYLQQ